MEQKKRKSFALWALKTLMWCGLWLVAGQALAATATVSRLRVNAMENPVGIDSDKPSFSWTLEAGEGERGVWQTAYEIRLYTDQACQNEFWTSGKVESGLSVDRPYNGPSLQAASRYYWRVTVWDNKGREATSDEMAYFEMGLMNEGWSGAKWISPTTLKQDEYEITRYDVETDFQVENLAAGIIFAARSQDTYCMWQVNFEAGYPRFRPHVWTNGQASCLVEEDLRPLISLELHKTYHLRIEVDGSVARTYIDDVLIDTRECPWGGNYGYGQIGIRQDRALNNYNDLERAYFDNFKVTDKTGQTDKVLINETFDEGSQLPFSAGTLTDGKLYVEAQYSWYDKSEDEANYDLTLDMRIGRDNAGVVFSAYDTQNFHMWSFNVRDAAHPFLRRHLKVNGGYTTSDVSLADFFTKEQLMQQYHQVKIAVRGQIVKTFIDDQLVDTYTDNSGRLHLGEIGFRAFFDKTMDEEVYYDNVKLTVYDEDNQPSVTFSENFEGPGNAFDGGEVVVDNGQKVLFVSSPYEENCVMRQSQQGMPLFRKKFVTDAPIKRARLYTSALGVYDVFINGDRVGRKMDDGTLRFDELKPGWTDYRYEVFYTTYDVTDWLKEGDNAIGAQVSHGWWKGAIAHGIYGTPESGFIARLDIEYEDGRKQTVVTDTDWLSAYCGPLVLGDIYNGETYDARRDKNWSQPDYDDSSWYQTVENSDFNGEPVAWEGPTVQVRQSLCRRPQTITVYDGVDNTGTTYGQIHVVRTLNGDQKLQLKAGETAIFDMGQNMVGWVRFTAKGEAGTQLKFRFGEMLNDTGDANRADDGPGGSVYTYNLRTAKATLLYTLNGDKDGENYAPSSTFFGFRYCQVTASADVELTGLTGEVVGSALEETATFETDHPDVNQLYSNIIWGQRGNFLSIPTDCPQRDERLGWTGDTQIFSRTACYNSDARAFYRKWMRDMRHGQREDGAYPDTAPFCNFWGFGNAAWGDAGVIVPWTVYLMTGDTQILADNYESMSHYMDFLASQTGGGFTYNGAGVSFGDWLAYEEMDARYVSVCYYAYVAELMSKIAGVLGSEGDENYQADALKYAELHDAVRKEFQNRFVGTDGLPTVATQTAYLLALQFDLLSETSKAKVQTALRRKIVGNGYKLSTGFVGTGLLNQTLSQCGMDDLAYDLLLQRDNPSWLYSVDQGATTIWERWDSYTKDGGFNKHPWIMNSFNHYAYGVVAEWLYRYVAGIESDESQPGFKHIILQPTPDVRDILPQNQARINKASASYRSVYGMIRSEWQLNGEGGLDYQVTVPVNTTATLYLPLTDETDEVTESGKALAEAEGITYKGVKDGCAVMELVSGTYHFNVVPGGSVSVKENSVQSLDVQPNPFSDFLEISAPSPVKDLTVFGGNGNMICKQDHGGRINTSSWSPGVYVVYATFEDATKVCKVIKY